MSDEAEAPILRPFDEEAIGSCEHGVRDDAEHDCEACNAENHQMMGLIVGAIRDEWNRRGRYGTQFPGVSEENAFRIWKSGWLAGTFGSARSEGAT